ncbi:hypothetical protein LOAG_14615 [Loa loa]|uniref:Uncharacterized protein n=1 Tax=Loa loa TaxID=7209 RepID=A0A1S0TIE3_LOALO|nr:hypothetical protein LOAG_14615 [Loa loa]EFO13911.1 hypothetical protein LOAG_14615 [Loa loa]
MGKNLKRRWNGREEFCGDDLSSSSIIDFVAGTVRYSPEQKWVVTSSIAARNVSSILHYQKSKKGAVVAPVMVIDKDISNLTVDIWINLMLYGMIACDKSYMVDKGSCKINEIP